MKNKNNMKCKARKDYVCDQCGAKIPKGTSYRRLNINYVGVRHFCCAECKRRYESNGMANMWGGHLEMPAEYDIDILNEVLDIF